MKPDAYITTSWDDGHPLDLRIAELLAKHGLRGTFYVPAASERGTMSPGQLRDLAASFEIGAHTLGHLVLTALDDVQARREIIGGKTWLEDTLGVPCAMFCPPKGRYGRRHGHMVRQAGYLGLRSGELGSLEFPRRDNALLVMPTTVQAYPHARVMDFVRNAVKRAALGNLWRFVVHGRSTEWDGLSRRLLRQTLAHGGVFHLWGHSWELGEQEQWRRLDAVLGAMVKVAHRAPPMSNGEICRREFARARDAASVLVAGHGVSIGKKLR
jgi:peptidoglycan/xylan/chitin deacetylase (PgdA/CDA1 family)